MVTVPAATPLGAFYVLACADDLLKVAEIAEVNNCVASASQVDVRQPDLAVTAIGASAWSARAGTKFTVTDTVINLGNIAAPGSTIRYYLSVDAIREAGDFLLTGARSMPELGVNATSTGSKAVTVPLGVPGGTYFLIACADPQLKIVESDEVNNCRAADATMAITP
jgi:subtilase family serine protease